MLKLIRTIIGGILVLLGMIFVLIPGPSLLLILPGLMLLSFDYPIARIWLAKCQRLAAKSAKWIDSRVFNKTHFR